MESKRGRAAARSGRTNLSEPAPNVFNRDHAATTYPAATSAAAGPATATSATAATGAAATTYPAAASAGITTSAAAGAASKSSTTIRSQLKRRFDFVVSESAKWGNRNAHGLRFVSLK
jgi:hypothetical protein